MKKYSILFGLVVLIAILLWYLLCALLLWGVVALLLWVFSIHYTFSYIMALAIVLVLSIVKII